LGVLAAWATIVLCQLRLYRMAKAGTTQRPAFQMPWAPYSGYVTLAFLAGVVVLMALDGERGPWIIAALVIGAPALVGGWFLVRNRVRDAAAEVAGDVPPAPEPEPEPDDRPPAPANPAVG
jgi:L-asparagine permease